MDCPRCRLSLSESEYEGEHVHFCRTCWGYWLTRRQLFQITGSIQYRFSNQSVRAIEKSFETIGDSNRQGSEGERIHCPVCGVEMANKIYMPDCPVKIDECDEHGIWLDTGEIKDLQVFIERSLEV